MAVVTVGGPRGGAREELAAELARLLGAELVDREAMAREAQRLVGASPEEMKRRFEQGPVGGRLGRAIQTFLERSAAAGSAGDPFLGPTGVEVLLSRSIQEAAAPATSPKQELDDKHYLDAMTRVITEVAAVGNAVFLGGGSAFILRDIYHALRVNTIAPVKVRVERVMTAEGVDEATAQRLVKEADDARRAYIKKYFKVDVEDSSLYDIVVNTGQLPAKLIAPMLAELATTKHGLYAH